ncbi:MAG: hypothetical protein ABEH40_05705 [Haloferacaceae archaeon]
MYGAITRDAEAVGRPAFDLGFYEVKDVSGRAAEPLSGAVNAVSCFADNAAAASDPDLVPVDAEGRPANPDRPHFDWSYVCPTHPDYRAGLLEIVSDCAAAAPDVRLDDVGFPRDGYCRCDRCDRLFAESGFEDRAAWRAEVVGGFVADAAARVPGDCYLTVHPDPYPGHLRRRSGIDLDAVLDHVDEVVVPLYDTAYGTTYWLESIARGFRTALAGGDPEGEPRVPLAVELYAANVDLEALVGAAEVADAYADDVLFGYDTSAAAGAIRRLRAEGNADAGEAYGPGDGAADGAGG